MPLFDPNRGNNSSQMMPRLRMLVLTVLFVLPLGSPAVESASTPAVPAFSHIFVIIMENREFGEVVNPSQAPFITKLARDYAVANPYYAVTHPSLPNYIALTGGDTFGITDDCTDCPVTGEHLADQVDAHQRTWKAYMEGLPAACFLGSSSGEYAKKHNPFVYYTNIATTPARCRQVVPLSELDTDLSRGSLPDLVWITPDMCHSMHDCETRGGSVACDHRSQSTRLSRLAGWRSAFCDLGRRDERGGLLWKARRWQSGDAGDQPIEPARVPLKHGIQPLRIAADD